MHPIAALPGTVTVAAGTTSAGAEIAMPDTANGLLVVNTSTTARVTIALGHGEAPTATIGSSGPTLPPASSVLIEANARLTHVAAVASAADVDVVFTPVRL